MPGARAKCRATANKNTFKEQKRPTVLQPEKEIKKKGVRPSRRHGGAHRKNLQEPEHKEKSLERGSYRLKSDNFTPGNAGRAKGVFWLMAIPPCKRKAKASRAQEVQSPE